MWYNNTGNGVSVAIIDSGIDNCGSGVSIYEDLTMEEYGYDFDLLGHGNVIADIISHYAPNVKLISVKVFHESLTCSTVQLEKAIQWCIDREIDIINISAAFESEKTNIDTIHNLCKLASKKGIIIVSAIDYQRSLTVPGELTEVIAVQSNLNVPIGSWKVLDSYNSIIDSNGYWNTSIINNRSMKGYNYVGCSNSCAFISAMTAKIKENESFVTVSKILEILNESEYIGIKNINEYDERKTYALLPVNSENCHLLNYLNINYVYAFPWMGLNGQTIKEKYPFVHKDVEITNDMEEFLSTPKFDIVLFNIGDEKNNLDKNEELKIFNCLFAARKPLLLLSQLGIDDELLLSRELINSGNTIYVKGYKAISVRYDCKDLTSFDLSQKTNNRTLILSTSTYNITSEIEIIMYKMLKDSFDFITRNEHLKLIGLKTEDEYVEMSNKTIKPNVIMTMNRSIFPISKETTELLESVERLKECVRFRPNKILLVVAFPDPVEYIVDYIAFIKYFFNMDVEKVIVSNITLDPTLYSINIHSYVPASNRKTNDYIKKLNRKINIPVCTTYEVEKNYHE